MKSIALLVVILVILVGCKRAETGASIYRGSGAIVDEVLEVDGHDERETASVEPDVLQELQGDDRALVVIEINNKFEARNARDFKRLLQEKKTEFSKLLAEHRIKIIDTFDEGNAFTAEITSEALEYLQKSPYVESIKTVKIIKPRQREIQDD